MIVALDSASGDLSVAVAGDDGRLLADDGWTADRQGHQLLPRLLALLEREGRRLEELTAVAVGTGPGSFTGLRVGMSVAKGLAYGLRRPIVGVPSLRAWLVAVPDAAAAVARAGAAEAFVLTRADDEPLVVGADALRGRRPGIRLVAAHDVSEAFALVDARPPSGAAAAIARLAAARLAEHPAGDDLERLEPAYGRGPRGIGQVSGEAVRWL